MCSYPLFFFCPCVCVKQGKFDIVMGLMHAQKAFMTLALGVMLDVFGSPIFSLLQFVSPHAREFLISGGNLRKQCNVSDLVLGCLF